MNARSNSDFLPTMPPNLSDRGKIDFIEKYMRQMWQRQIEDRENIAAIRKLVDSELPSSRIVAMIREGLGNCVTKDEFRIFKTSM